MSTDPTVWDLSTFNPDHLNQVAGLLADLHGGFLPLDVRYQAAAAALARAAERTSRVTCPIDGQPLAAIRRELNEPAVFVHRDGTMHLDRLAEAGESGV